MTAAIARLGVPNSSFFARHGQALPDVDETLPYLLDLRPKRDRPARKHFLQIALWSMSRALSKCLARGQLGSLAESNLVSNFRGRRRLRRTPPGFLGTLFESEPRKRGASPNVASPFFVFFVRRSLLVRCSAVCCRCRRVCARRGSSRLRTVWLLAGMHLASSCATEMWPTLAFVALASLHRSCVHKEIVS